MPKFSTKEVRPNVTAPVKTTGPTTRTHEGGTGYARDAKSELFLLAITNMVAEDTFYESAGGRDDRFAALIHQVTAEDPGWIAGFVPYLRNTMQMRSASVVMAAEYVKAKGSHGRAVVNSAISRADEPAEILAYWAQTHGRRFPQPLKRGVADAVRRVYNENAAIRYDGVGKAWRMGDVIELVHPRPTAAWQAALFEYLLSVRHARKELNTEALPTLNTERALQAMAVETRRANLALAGQTMSWERLSGWLNGPMDAGAWEAVIPKMGYMALLRNLRNFEQAGISEPMKEAVITKLSDPDEVAKSRQFPLRFLSAMKAVGGFDFLRALEKAANGTLANVPALSGRTLILVDDSGSMDSGISSRSTLSRREAAAMFGAALALRAEHADLIAYATQGVRVPIPKGGAVLKLAQATSTATHGGTETIGVLLAAYQAHDRVVILTDEQAFALGGRYVGAFGGYDEYASQDVAGATAHIPLIYTFNLAGYRAGHLPAGEHGRYTFGGLTDSAFTMIPLLESLKDASWPWETSAA